MDCFDCLFCMVCFLCFIGWGNVGLVDDFGLFDECFVL